MIIYLRRSLLSPGQRRAMLLVGVTLAAVTIGWLGEAQTSASFRQDVGTPRADTATAAPGTRWRAEAPAAAAAERPTAARFAPPVDKASVTQEGPAGVALEAPPFQYVGHWTDRGTTRVVLGGRGGNVVVRVPGNVDARYQVLSVDENRLVLKVLPLGVVQTLALVPGAPWMLGSPMSPAGTGGTASPAPSTMLAPGGHAPPAGFRAGTGPTPADAGERDTEAEN